MFFNLSCILGYFSKPVLCLLNDTMTFEPEMTLDNVLKNWLSHFLLIICRLKYAYTLLKAYPSKHHLKYVVQHLRKCLSEQKRFENVRKSGEDGTHFEVRRTIFNLFSNCISQCCIFDLQIIMFREIVTFLSSSIFLETRLIEVRLLHEYQTLRSKYIFKKSFFFKQLANKQK